MIIERVRIKKTLKWGKKVYWGGGVLKPPLPSEILDEIIHNTGTVHAEGLPEKFTKKDLVEFSYKPEMKTPDMVERALKAQVETNTQTTTKAGPEPEVAPEAPKKLLVRRGKPVKKAGGKK
jgi:hypothetical protein